MSTDKGASEQIKVQRQTSLIIIIIIKNYFNFCVAQFLGADKNGLQQQLKKKEALYSISSKNHIRPYHNMEKTHDGRNNRQRFMSTKSTH